MAILSVEISSARFVGGSAIYGRCIYQESITIGGAASSAVTDAMAAAGATVARIQANDTACYFAIGVTPDAAATAATAASTARRLLPANTSADVDIGAGMAVKAVVVS